MSEPVHAEVCGWGPAERWVGVSGSKRAGSQRVLQKTARCPGSLPGLDPPPPPPDHLFTKAAVVASWAVLERARPAAHRGSAAADLVIYGLPVVPNDWASLG